MEEAELISRCRKEDRAAQEQLFIRYSAKMMGICMRYTKNKDDARDLLHDGFIKIFSHIKGFKEESSVSTWMTRIFVNMALTFLKSKHNRYQYIEPGEDIPEELEEDIPESILDELSGEEVMEMVKMLPDKYRLIINLYSIDGFTHKMIAEQLDISEGTSKSQLSRARKLLVKMISLRKKKNEKSGK